MNRPTALLAAALLIALAPVPAARAAAPTPEIVEGEVRYDDGAGFVRIAGELRNASSKWVCSPRVEVELYDAANQPIAVESTVTLTRTKGAKPGRDGAVAERTWLAPGEVAAFVYARERRQLGGVEPASHRLFASARRCPGPPPQMAIDNFATQKSESGWWSASGAIRNDGKVPCRSPRAVLGLYGADGRLVSALSVVPDATFRTLLAPGELVRFERRSIPEPPGRAVARLEAWGDCDWPE